MCSWSERSRKSNTGGRDIISFKESVFLQSAKPKVKHSTCRFDGYESLIPGAWQTASCDLENASYLEAGSRGVRSLGPSGLQKYW